MVDVEWVRCYFVFDVRARSPVLRQMDRMCKLVVQGGVEVVFVTSAQPPLPKYPHHLT